MSQPDLFEKTQVQWIDLGAPPARLMVANRAGKDLLLVLNGHSSKDALLAMGFIETKQGYYVTDRYTKESGELADLKLADFRLHFLKSSIAALDPAYVFADLKVRETIPLYRVEPIDSQPAKLSSAFKMAAPKSNSEIIIGLLSDSGIELQPSSLYFLHADYEPGNSGAIPIEVRTGPSGDVDSLTTWLFDPKSDGWRKDLVVNKLSGAPLVWLNEIGNLSKAVGQKNLSHLMRMVVTSKYKGSLKNLEEQYPQLTVKKETAQAQISINSAVPIAKNFEGSQVFESAGKRFILGEDGEPIWENLSLSASTFLRTGVTSKGSLDYADLYRNALAFALSSQSAKASDASSFIKIITPTVGLALAGDQLDTYLRSVFSLAYDVALASIASTGLQSNSAEAVPYLELLLARQSDAGRTFAPIPLSMSVSKILSEITGAVNVLEISGRDPALMFAVAGKATVTSSIDADFELGPALKLITTAAIQHNEHLRRRISIADPDVPPPTNMPVVYGNFASGGRELSTAPNVFNNDLIIQRKDHAQLLSELSALPADGVGVFIIEGNTELSSYSSDEVNVFQWVADRFNLLPIVTLDKGLFSQTDSSSDIGHRRLVIVRGRRKEVENAPLPQEITFRDYRSLYSYASDLAPDISGHIRTSQNEVDLRLANSDDDAEVEQDLQVKYESLTEGNSVACMMTPVNLREAHGKALARISKKYGGPANAKSAFLERMKLPQDFKAIDPHQVDATLLAFEKLDNSGGFIIGDQTGTGKTRTIAAIIKDSILRDQPVIFLTERKGLFNTLWNELSILDGTRHARLAVINPGVAVKDAKGIVIAEGSTKGTKELMGTTLSSSGSLGGPNLVLGTYSQFSAEKSPRAKWLRDEARHALLILDESHNAAGLDSNTANNLKMSITEAKAVLYSSATYAKVAYNIPIYCRAVPANISSDRIAQIIEVGGEPLQETLCAMLVEDGALIRREQDAGNLDIQIVSPDDGTRELNRGFAKSFAESMTVLANLNESIGSFMRALSVHVASQTNNMLRVRTIPLNTDTTFKSNGIGNKIYMLTKQFLVSMKPDFVANRALEHLQAGRKPIVAVENTMGELLKEYVANRIKLEQLERGEKVVTEDEIPRIADGMRIPDMPQFRDILKMVALNMTTIILKEKIELPAVAGESPKFKTNTHRLHISEVEHIIATEPSLRVQYASIQQMIKDAVNEMNKFPHLPVSPIDSITHALNGRQVKLPNGELSQVRVGELTRRGFSIDKSGAGDYVVSERADQNEVDIVSAFNSGEIDVLVINKSAASGIDLHSSSDFKDQRQRALMETQVMENITDRLQLYGRVNRLNQVSEPILENISSGLVVEERVFALQNRKIRKISAQTTSNQKNPLLAETPDMLNIVGDKSAVRFLSKNLAIAKTLSLTVESDEENVDYIADATSGSRQTTNVMNTVLSRLVLIPPDEADEVYKSLVRSYKDTLNDLKSASMNPLETHTLTGEIRVIDRDAVTDVDLDASEESSVFDAPVYRTLLERKTRFSSYTPSDIQKIINSSSRHVNHVGARRGFSSVGQQAFLGLASTMKTRLQTLIDRKLGAMYPGWNRLSEHQHQRAIASLNETIRLIPFIQPGSIIYARPSSYMPPCEMVVIDAELPETIEQAVSFSYPIKVLAPGMKPIKTSLAHLSDTSIFRPLAAFFSEDHPIAQEFARKTNVFTRTNELVLDGNLFRAAQTMNDLKCSKSQVTISAQSSPIVYTDENGNRNRGLLIKGSERVAELFKEIPAPLATYQLVNALLDQRGTKVATAAYPSASRDIYFEITRDANGVAQPEYCTIYIPSTSKGREILQDALLSKILSGYKFTTSKYASALHAVIPRALVEPAAAALSMIGYHFYRKHKESVWATNQLKGIVKTTPYACVKQHFDNVAMGSPTHSPEHQAA